jgi:hypothetical protein
VHTTPTVPAALTGRAPQVGPGGVFAAQGVLPGPPGEVELGRQQELRARWLGTQDLTAEERTRVERLIAEGVLPGPHLGDAAPLATLGIDLEAVAGRLEESFGREAYWQATERVRNRPAQGATHRPMGVPPPFVCARVFAVAAHEAIAKTSRSAPSICCWGCCGTPRIRSRPSRLHRSDGCGARSACPTTVPMRSSCWSRRTG